MSNTNKQTSKDKQHEVEIELEENKLLVLCLMAHEQDITLNQLINSILRKKLQELPNVEKKNIDK